MTEGADRTGERRPGREWRVSEHRYERTIARYRSLLEMVLEQAVPDEPWTRVAEIAVVAGARMLLWPKALALDAGRDGAETEWRWWIDRLEATPDSTTP